ncbi:MAG TPA: chaplin ChpH, partial [Streptomyces sp.]|nr:chaplin ChpH [Streptomyces sp.]
MLKKVVAAAAATGGLVLAGAGMAVADAGAQG